MTDLATGRSLSYQSGAWYGVVGPHVVVLLPPEEKARVAGIWTLADGGAGFDETLDALIADGLRALHGFVLVSGSEGDTKVVIRGEAHALFVAAGERVEVEGSAGSTWVERSLHDVTGMEIVVGDAPEGTPSYVMETGLVRVARISEGSVTVPEPEPEPTPEPYVEPEPAGPGLAVVGGAAATGAPGVGAVPPPVATFGADVPDAPELPDLPDVPDLSDERDEVAAPETPEVPAEPEEDDGPPTDIFSVVPAEPEPVVPIEVDPWIDPAGELEPEPSFGASFDLTPEPEPVPEPVLAPVPVADEWAPVAAELPDEPSSYDLEGADDEDIEDDDDLYGPDAETGLMSAVDHDGQTHLSPFDQDELALVRPGIPGQEPAPEVTARAVARLVVSTGETVDVDRVVILGRAPSPRSDSSAEQPVLVRLPSPHQEISSTHVEVRPGSGADHGTAVVTDLGSTNGTIVVQPGLEPEELQPGVSVQLIPGAVIDLGDGVTIQVVRA